MVEIGRVTEVNAPDRPWQTCSSWKERLDHRLLSWPRPLGRDHRGIRERLRWSPLVQRGDPQPWLTRYCDHRGIREPAASVVQMEVLEGLRLEEIELELGQCCRRQRLDPLP